MQVHFKCQFVGCTIQPSAQASVYSFFFCRKNHSVHKKHINDMKAKKDYSFLQSCQVCRDGAPLDPVVASNLFKEMEIAILDFAGAQVGVIANPGKLECPCGEAMIVKKADEYDVGVCFRGKEMCGPSIRCRLCFDKYHEGRPCDFRNANFEEVRRANNTRRQCPTCLAYSITADKPGRDQYDPRYRCGVCQDHCC